MQMPRFIEAPLLQRYRVMFNFDLATHRGKPQQGNVEIKYRDLRYELLASATPTKWGDKLTIRILDQNDAMCGLKKLGFTPEVQAGIEELAQRRSGLLLFAGPSRSGRSTTQYSLLNKLNSIEQNILTIEPSNSYVMPGMSQVELRCAPGLSYNSVWQAAQDVDILHIDRVMNSETAELAMSAAERGVLTLAAVDAPNAVSGLVRMVE